MRNWKTKPYLEKAVTLLFLIALSILLTAGKGAATEAIFAEIPAEETTLAEIPVEETPLAETSPEETTLTAAPQRKRP